MTVTLLISGLFLAGFLAQWAAWRLKLPAILLLLLAGVVLGPGVGLLVPEEVFGDLLFPFISLAVAVILFEGALTLRFEELRNLGKVVRRLVTVGALVTWVVVAVTTHLLFDISTGVAVLFGAVMVVTGPTVIVPLLRTVRPTVNIGRVLRWEGIVIDPIGALLAVVVFEFLTTTQSGHAYSHSLWTFVTVIFSGLGFGAGGGALLDQLLKRHLIPEYLQNMATLTLVFLVFSLSNHLSHESGLLAVTVMGMWLANTQKNHIAEILNFKENLSILLISGLFIVLAARIDVQAVGETGLRALVLLAVIQFVARPATILISTLGSDLNWRERALLCWIAPRGIVAAAVSAVFAVQLEAQGYAGAELLVPLTFTVIIGTVLLQSLTAKPLAKLLGVAESSPRGFLIVGANPVAQAIGGTLKDLGFDVLLCDSNWSCVKSARMAGLNCFYGSPVSEYAAQKLDLVGLGNLLALSPHRELNAIAAMRYRSEFGQSHIFTLLDEEDSLSSEKHRLSGEHHGNLLFNRFLTYSKFEELLNQGAEIKRTKLTEEFDFDDYQQHHHHRVMPMFALSPKGRLQIFVDGEAKVKPEPGWTVLSLNYENIA